MIESAPSHPLPIGGTHATKTTGVRGNCACRGCRPPRQTCGAMDDDDEASGGTVNIAAARRLRPGRRRLGAVGGCLQDKGDVTAGGVQLVPNVLRFTTTIQRSDPMVPGRALSRRPSILAQRPVARRDRGRQQDTRQERGRENAHVHRGRGVRRRCVPTRHSTAVRFSCRERLRAAPRTSDPPIEPGDE